MHFSFKHRCVRRRANGGERKMSSPFTLSSGSHSAPKLQYFLVSDQFHSQARREGERRKIFPGPKLSWGPRAQCRINPWRTPIGFELQTKVHKNKFLFISVLTVLLILVGPYWSWWALGFSQVCYGLELYQYHLCRLLKYPMPIMRLIIYKSVHSKCLFPKQRSTIANQEHILLLTLTIMELVCGCTIYF